MLLDAIYPATDFKHFTSKLSNFVAVRAANLSYGFQQKPKIE